MNLGNTNYNLQSSMFNYKLFYINHNVIDFI